MNGTGGIERICFSLLNRRTTLGLASALALTGLLASAQEATAAPVPRGDRGEGNHLDPEAAHRLHDVPDRLPPRAVSEDPGRPLPLAQRPLPSMMMATCAGISPGFSRSLFRFGVLNFPLDLPSAPRG